MLLLLLLLLAGEVVVEVAVAVMVMVVVVVVVIVVGRRVDNVGRRWCGCCRVRRSRCVKVLGWRRWRRRF